MNIEYLIKESAEVISSLSSHSEEIMKMADIITNCLKNGNKILIMGNGGSAADSQHIAAEIVGRYKKERKGYPAIALTTDTSILTAIGNDYSYDYIFVRQIEALAREKDVVLGISTSGNSKNIIEAINKANELNCITLGLLGKDGGKLKDVIQHSLIIKSNNTPRIQEAHQFIYHTICEIVEDCLTNE